MKHARWVILWLTLPVLLVWGQPHNRTPAAADAKHQRAPNAAPAATDAEIQRRIQEKLARSKIGKNGFRFTTSGGITTIEGTAAVIQHKGAATRMAKSAGARAVVNNIKISEQARQAAREKLAAGRRRAQIKRGDPRSEDR